MSQEDAKPKDDEDDRALDLQVTEYLKLGVPAGTVACAVAAGFLAGAPAVVLVLAGGALVAAIAIFWSSVRTLVGETPLTGADAYALGAPRAEEEQKRAVLRALKDLEFERSVGKISEEDYQALVARYRAEAKRLLRTLDEEAQPERERVEALVKKRLERDGLSERDDEDDKPEAAPQEPPKPKAKREKQKASSGESIDAKTVACAKCGTKNDVDAVFCKKCGARRDESASDEESERDEGDRKETST